MRALVTITVLATLGAAAAPAHADKADKLFKKGKKLLAEKKYAEACRAFEEVDGLEPGIGAKLNVARCYEEWGRLATAYRWYGDAEKMAEDSKDDRAPKIKDLIAELDTNVPRVTIKVADGADPDVVATVTFDGKPIDPSFLNSEQRVDPGPHVIEFIVDGKKKKKMAPVERGGESEVSLDIPRAANKKIPRDGVIPPDEPVARPGRTQRIAGVSLAIGGGAALATAAILTVSARGTYRDALEAHCMGSTSMCDPEGLEITHDARKTANIATVVTIAGGAMIVGGVVLYLVAPKAAKRDEHALYLTPVLGGDGGGVVFGGRY